MHRLAENRDIYIAYIIKRMEEIVGVEDTTWNAAVLLSDQLAENLYRDIYIAYIIKRMEEIAIVGVEDTTWNAAVLLSDQNDKMVFILPSVATAIHNLNSER